MILFTHNSDLDGIGNIILAQYYQLPITEYFLINYEDEENLLSNLELEIDFSQKVVFTDFSVSENLYHDIKKKFTDYLIFDHHEDSYQLKLKYPEDDKLKISKDYSGTGLFYNFLKTGNESQSLDYFSTLVDTYDSWRTDSPLWEEAQNLNRVFWKMLKFQYGDKDILKFKFFIDYELNKIKNNSTWLWTDYENKLIQEAIEKENNEVLSAKKNMQVREDTKGIKYIIYHGSSKVSITCNTLLKENPEVQYIINVNTYTGSSKKKVNGHVSLRSIDTFDVTQLAGINGHKQAGAGEFTESFIVDLWTKRIKGIPYKREVSN